MHSSTKALYSLQLEDIRKRKQWILDADTNGYLPNLIWGWNLSTKKYNYNHLIWFGHLGLQNDTPYIIEPLQSWYVALKLTIGVYFAQTITKRSNNRANNYFSKRNLRIKPVCYYTTTITTHYSSHQQQKSGERFRCMQPYALTP